VRFLNSEIMFENIKIFKTKIVNVRKKHQCVKCGGKIEAKEKAENTTISYDGRLISTYFCGSCVNLT